jgi:hypothetical protein
LHLSRDDFTEVQTDRGQHRENRERDESRFVGAQSDVGRTISALPILFPKSWFLIIFLSQVGPWALSDSQNQGKHPSKNLKAFMLARKVDELFF